MTPTASPARRIARGILYTVLGSWFLATLVSQDPTRRHPGLRKYDKIGLLIPDWRFFAPRPGMNDHHLLFRDELGDGSRTDWKEVASPQARRLSHALCYPSRRAEKALTDAASSLMMIAGGGQLKKKEDIQLSLAYLTMLNFVSHQVPHAPGTAKTQFALATAAGFDEEEEPEVLFLSNLHRIG